MSRKGKRVQMAIYLDPSAAERLKELSKKTRVPMAVYIRDGIDVVLRENGV